MALGRQVALRRAAADAPAPELRTAGQTWQATIDTFYQQYGYLPSTVYRGAFSVPAAWRASLLLADIISTMPIDEFREIAGKQAEEVAPKSAFLRQPNPPEPAMNTMHSWVLDLVYEGNAIAILPEGGRNSGGTPTVCWPVPANMVSARRVLINGMPPLLPVGPIEYLIGGVTFQQDQILHIKGPCPPGSVRGYGVLEAHMKTLALANTQADQAATVGLGIPTGLLKSANPDLTDVEAAKLKAKWLEAQRTRTIAVLNPSTDFVPLAWTPENMEIVEARQFTNSEIALIFGVPARLLNVEVASMTYANIEQEDINILRYSTSGHVGRFEGGLSGLLPRGRFVKFNLDSRLRPDTKTRYEAHQVGITAGFLLKSEARAYEDLPPVPGIDKPPPAPVPPAAPALPPGTPAAAAPGEDDTAGKPADGPVDDNSAPS